MEKIDGKISGSLSDLQEVSGTLQGTRNVKGNMTSAPVIVERDYNKLENMPQIESVTLKGNKTFKQLGLDTLSVQEIEKILYLD